MAKPHKGTLLWEEQNRAWRNPAQVASLWTGADAVDPAAFKYRESGNFFSTLDELEVTLLVTREYEHLVMAITVADGKPVFSYLSLPHPSGLAVDLKKQIVYVASTRNPNMIFEFAPLKENVKRLDADAYGGVPAKPLMPRRARFLAGCFYIHDLALIGGELYANSVGQNAVVRLDSAPRIVWWPRCIERNGKPVFGQNHIQLNSIAAGENIAASFFSASADKISARRPGHHNFPVDQRGVIFSGKTREPVAFGLTRPHSARLYKKQLYVDNSGYGEFSMIKDGSPMVISKLPGWTRGLGIYRGVAFVGVSRVIPRFRQYAPGLDVDKSLCGIYAVDLNTGSVLGSVNWTYGNQIFEVLPLSRKITRGFPSVVGRKNSLDEARKLYYTFSL